MLLSFFFFLTLITSLSFIYTFEEWVFFLLKISQYAMTMSQLTLKRENRLKSANGKLWLKIQRKEKKK